MDITSIWGQVLLNACGVRIQQILPNIIISQDPISLLPITSNSLVSDDVDDGGNSDDSASEENDGVKTDVENEVTRENDGVEDDKTEDDNQKKGKVKKIVRTREEYQCPQCPYKCTTENAFVKHLRFCDSSDLRPLSCPVCGKDRKSEQSLQLHLLKHKQGKQFCCDLCKFKSAQLKKIIQHRRMHTGEKPHLCPHCTYRSSRRDNLRSHVRRVHKKDDLNADTFSPTSMLKSPRTHS